MAQMVGDCGTVLSITAALSTRAFTRLRVDGAICEYTLSAGIRMISVKSACRTRETCLFELIHNQT